MKLASNRAWWLALLLCLSACKTQSFAPIPAAGPSLPGVSSNQSGSPDSGAASPGSTNNVATNGSAGAVPFLSPSSGGPSAAGSKGPVGTSAIGSLQPNASVKKGLGMWGLPGSQGAQAGAGWYYNWQAAPTMGDSGALEYVPMIWGASQATAANFAAIQSGGYKELLGFNEPDHSDQANMSVAQAIQLWPQFMATGLRLGSPAAASAPNWIQDFMQQANQLGYRVDFLAVHYYPNALDSGAVATMKTWLDGLHAQFNLPIWVTEFGICGFSTPGQLSTAQLQTFVSQVVEMLESLSYVERYAWFADYADGDCSQSAVFSGNSLTTTGQVYTNSGQSAGD